MNYSPSNEEIALTKEMDRVISIFESQGIEATRVQKGLVDSAAKEDKGYEYLHKGFHFYKLEDKDTLVTEEQFNQLVALIKEGNHD